MTDTLSHQAALTLPRRSELQADHRAVGHGIWSSPQLVVLVGESGTGKTTLARMVATELRAAHIRLDAIQSAVLRSNVASASFGLVGYLVAYEIAAGCLAVSTPVVVDAVSAVPNARRGWADVAATAGVPLRMVEVTLSDSALHRRRVESRVSDLAGLRAPSWADVCARTYEPWDEERDGPRLVVDNATSPEEALDTIRAYIADD
jgi:predicted kinase